MMPVMTTCRGDDGGYTAVRLPTTIGLLPISAREKSVVLSLNQAEWLKSSTLLMDTIEPTKRTEQDGQLFQRYIQLAVNQDHRKKRYQTCRCREKTKSACQFLIGLVGGAGCDQQRTDRIEAISGSGLQTAEPIFFESLRQAHKTDGNQQPELRRRKSVMVERLLPVLQYCRQV